MEAELTETAATESMDIEPQEVPIPEIPQTQDMGFLSEPEEVPIPEIPQTQDMGFLSEPEEEEDEPAEPEEEAVQVEETAEVLEETMLVESPPAQVEVVDSPPPPQSEPAPAEPISKEVSAPAEPPAAQPPPNEAPLLPKSNKRKRPFAHKSTRKKLKTHVPDLQKKEPEPLPAVAQEAYIPEMHSRNGNFYQQQLPLQGGMSLQGGIVAPVQATESRWVKCAFCEKWRKIPMDITDAMLGSSWSCHDNKWDNQYNECRIPQEEVPEEQEIPFTEEELNEPLVHPGSDPKQTAPAPEAFVQDSGYDVDQSYQQGAFQVPSVEEDDYVEPVRKKKKSTATRKKRTRRRTVRSSSTVSLAALLESNDGVSAQYGKERKDFYQDLEAYLKRPPDVNLLCGAPVDLYQLYTETYNRGGYEQVCAAKQWRQIFRQLPQYSSTHTSASYALKKIYRKNLLEYEQHQRAR